MSRGNSTEDKARLLRAVAFQIHRKIPAVEALTECFGQEGRGGKHRQYKQAGTVLESEGFVRALVVAELIGEEAASVLNAVDNSGDHRLLSGALNALADYVEAQG